MAVVTGKVTPGQTVKQLHLPLCRGFIKGGGVSLVTCEEKERTADGSFGFHGIQFNSPEHQQSVGSRWRCGEDVWTRLDVVHFYDHSDSKEGEELRLRRCSINNYGAFIIFSSFNGATGVWYKEEKAGDCPMSSSVHLFGEREKQGFTILVVDCLLICRLFTGTWINSRLSL